MLIFPRKIYRNEYVLWQIFMYPIIGRNIKHKYTVLVCKIDNGT